MAEPAQSQGSIALLRAGLVAGNGYFRVVKETYLDRRLGFVPLLTALAGAAAGADPAVTQEIGVRFLQKFVAIMIFFLIHSAFVRRRRCMMFPCDSDQMRIALSRDAVVCALNATKKQ